MSPIDPQKICERVVELADDQGIAPDAVPVDVACMMRHMVVAIAEAINEASGAAPAPKKASWFARMLGK